MKPVHSSAVKRISIRSRRTARPRAVIRSCASGMNSALHRRGAVLLIVLVALTVASAVLVSVVRLAAADRKAWQGEVRQVQAAWLAESGLERASARLRDDPDYRGETWTIPADALDGRHSGAVNIQVEPAADQPSQRRIRVTADFPNDPQHRARRTREVVVAISQGE